MKEPVRGTVGIESPLFMTMHRLGLNYQCEAHSCGSSWCSKVVDNKPICNWCWEYHELDDDVNGASKVAWRER